MPFIHKSGLTIIKLNICVKIPKTVEYNVLNTMNPKCIVTSAHMSITVFVQHEIPGNWTCYVTVVGFARIEPNVVLGKIINEKPSPRNPGEVGKDGPAIRCDRFIIKIPRNARFWIACYVTPGFKHRGVRVCK